MMRKFSQDRQGMVKYCEWVLPNGELCGLEIECPFCEYCELHQEVEDGKGFMEQSDEPE